MIKYYEDREYLNKVYDILENNEFQEMKTIIHHESNRLDHCLRVSYYSYKLAKFFKLDDTKVARAALLHDFFLEKNENTGIKKRMVTMFYHPEYALENAKKYFELSPIEEDIIVSHMFPIGRHIPKYFESWLVDLVDDIVAVFEKATVVRGQLSTATCFLVMILVNNLR